jgi:hypothetical protein
MSPPATSACQPVSASAALPAPSACPPARSQAGMRWGAAAAASATMPPSAAAAALPKEARHIAGSAGANQRAVVRAGCLIHGRVASSKDLNSMSRACSSRGVHARKQAEAKAGSAVASPKSTYVVVESKTWPRSLNSLPHPVDIGLTQLLLLRLAMRVLRPMRVVRLVRLL